MNQESPWWQTAIRVNSSHFLKSIHNLLAAESIYKTLISKELGIAIGDGSLTFFWQDCWQLNEPLCIAYRRFMLCLLKLAMISSLEYWSGNIWYWNIALRRPLFGWEIKQWDHLSDLIN